MAWNGASGNFYSALGISAMQNDGSADRQGASQSLANVVDTQQKITDNTNAMIEDAQKTLSGFTDGLTEFLGTDPTFNHETGRWEGGSGLAKAINHPSRINMEEAQIKDNAEQRAKSDNLRNIQEQSTYQSGQEMSNSMYNSLNRNGDLNKLGITSMDELYQIMNNKELATLKANAMRMDVNSYLAQIANADRQSGNNMYNYVQTYGKYKPMFDNAEQGILQPQYIEQAANDLENWLNRRGLTKEDYVKARTKADYATLGRKANETAEEFEQRRNLARLNSDPTYGIYNSIVAANKQNQQYAQQQPENKEDLEMMEKYSKFFGKLSPEAQTALGTFEKMVIDRMGKEKGQKYFLKLITEDPDLIAHYQNPNNFIKKQQQDNGGTGGTTTQLDTYANGGNKPQATIDPDLQARTNAYINPQNNPQTISGTLPASQSTGQQTYYPQPNTNSGNNINATLQGETPTNNADINSTLNQQQQPNQQQAQVSSNASVIKFDGRESLSVTGESGGDPSKISDGVGDPGGVSYGAFQISTPTMDLYFRESKGNFGQYFKGLKPGTKEFNDRWKEVQDEWGEAFVNDQKEFIDRTHYTPAVNGLKANGLDVENRSNALQNVVYSFAVSRGGESAANFIDEALTSRNIDPASASDDEIIRAIYQHEIANIKTSYRSSSPKVQAGRRKRAINEMGKALKMYKEETATVQQGSTGINQSDASETKTINKMSVDEINNKVLDAKGNIKPEAIQYSEKYKDDYNRVVKKIAFAINPNDPDSAEKAILQLADERFNGDIGQAINHLSYVQNHQGVTSAINDERQTAVNSANTIGDIDTGLDISRLVVGSVGATGVAVKSASAYKHYRAAKAATQTTAGTGAGAGAGTGAGAGAAAANTNFVLNAISKSTKAVKDFLAAVRDKGVAWAKETFGDKGFKDIKKAIIDRAFKDGKPRKVTIGNAAFLSVAGLAYGYARTDAGGLGVNDDLVKTLSEKIDKGQLTSSEEQAILDLIYTENGEDDTNAFGAAAGYLLRGIPIIGEHTGKSSRMADMQATISRGGKAGVSDYQLATMNYDKIVEDINRRKSVMSDEEYQHWMAMVQYGKSVQQHIRLGEMKKIYDSSFDENNPNYAFSASQADIHSTIANIHNEQAKEGRKLYNEHQAKTPTGSDSMTQIDQKAKKHENASKEFTTKASAHLDTRAMNFNTQANAAVGQDSAKTGGGLTPQAKGTIAVFTGQKEIYINGEKTSLALTAEEEKGKFVPKDKAEAIVYMTLGQYIDLDESQVEIIKSRFGGISDGEYSEFKQKTNQLMDKIKTGTIKNNVQAWKEFSEILFGNTGWTTLGNDDGLLTDIVHGMRTKGGDGTDTQAVGTEQFIRSISADFDLYSLIKQLDRGEKDPEKIISIINHNVSKHRKNLNSFRNDPERLKLYQKEQKEKKERDETLKKK